MQKKHLTNCFLQLQYQFIIKTLTKVGKEGLHLNTIKPIFDKLTTNMIFNDNKLRTFPIKSETRQECPLSCLFNIVLAVPATAIRQEKEIKHIQVGRGKIVTICR